MKHKKLLGLCAAAAIAVSGTTMASTLTLSSVNENSDIRVKCGTSVGSEKDTSLPIYAHQARKLPYYMVAAMGSNIWCDFYEDGSTTSIGTANIAIASDNKSATVLSHQNLDLTHFDVSIQNTDTGADIADGTSANNMTVTLTKK